MYETANNNFSMFTVTSAIKTVSNSSISEIGYCLVIKHGKNNVATLVYFVQFNIRMNIQQDEHTFGWLLQWSYTNWCGKYALSYIIRCKST